MNEQESKARLIVKRIVTDLARDQSTPLGCEWGSLNSETREIWVSDWIKIVSEVLGAEAELVDMERAIKDLCKQFGYETVMSKVSTEWMVHEEGSRVVGPRRSELVTCSCDRGSASNIECGWCCGTHKVTHRVKQAMMEADGQIEKPAQPPTEEQIFWTYASWTERFVMGMEGLGATKVSAPLCANGSVSVEFPKRSQVKTELNLSQKEREQIIKLLNEMDIAKAETEET